MVLRLPPEVAADVRAKLRNKEDVSDLILSFIDTKQALGLGRQTTAYGRMADVFACGRQFQARLLDLPCMIEALKTRNNQDYVKVGNVGQMLCVTEIEHAHMLPEPSDDAAFISPHGLTSAAHNALRRFRGDRKEITEDDRANMKRVLEEVERVHNKSVGKGNDGDKDETFEELELDDEEIEAMKKDLQVGKDIPLDNNGKSPRKRKASTKLTVGGGKKRPAAASGESSLPASSPPAGAYDMTSEQLGSGISTASGASPNVSPSARFVLSPPLTTAASPPGYSSDGGASPAYSPGYNSDGGGVYSDDAGAANSDEDGAVLSEEEGEEHADAAAPNSTGPAQSPQAQAEDDDDDDGLAGFMEDLEDELGSDDGEEGGGVEGGPVEGQIPADEGSAVAALDDPRLFEIAERLEELKKSLEAQRNPAMRSRLQDQIDKLVAEEQEISGRGGDSDLGTQDGEVVEGGAIEGSEIIDDAVGAAVDEEDTLEQELMQEFGVGNDGSFGLDAFDESDGW
eukprot:COSAG02_NODE_1166_length_14154_cov_19.442191_3_plen_512_part_00